MKLKKITTLLLLLCLSAAFTQSSENYDDVEDKLNKGFQNLYSSNTGGAAVALVKEGEIVFKNAYGMANLEYGIPNSINTIFHAASLSKQFTAYSILLLEKDGKLSLDDDLRKYIPEVPDFGQKITLRQLASHTSGLRDQWRLLYLAGWRSDDVILNEDIIDLVGNQKELNFEPGTKLMYSNTGFTLLAEVVARVSGKTFSQFTKERIFEPLNMINSQFYDNHNKIVKNRAYSYKKVNGEWKKDKLNFSTVGATSLFTTVMDLCKWGIHLNTLSKTDNDLSNRMNSQALLSNGEITEAAMGQWAGSKFNGMEWFDHSGSDASFRSYLGRFPESNSVVVYLGNTVPENYSASGYALAVVNGYLKEYYKNEDTTTSHVESKKPTKSKYKFIKLSKKDMSRFCGKYWEPIENYDREIKFVNDTLIYYRSEGNETKLLPIGKNEFKMLNDPNDVSVIFSENKRKEPIMTLNINDETKIDYIKYREQFKIDRYAGEYFNSELQNNITINNCNGELMIKIYKQEAAKLVPIREDFFKSTNREFRRIRFIRDLDGNIQNLLLSNDGVLNVSFKKIQ